MDASSFERLNLQDVDIDSLPVGLRLEIRVPGVGESDLPSRNTNLIEFTVDEEGLDLYTAIDHAIRKASVKGTGPFQRHTLQTLCLRLRSELEGKGDLQPDELKQYEFAEDPANPIKGNAYCAFIAMVLYRYNKPQ